MYKNIQYSDQLTFFQKLRSIDFILVFFLLLLGIISSFAMYSTDGGEMLYHTKSHIVRFSIFFLMMIFFSFFSLRFWFLTGYLYFLNLQPSELMKIAIIVCFAKFFHRVQIDSVNSLKNTLIPLVILIIPIFLVISQPDLGTSVLIALSGIIVIWLVGINIKYFVYSGLVMIISAPFLISFLKPYQKLRILAFFNPDKDPLGAGYQIIQSKIAVGSGGIFGKGYLEGTQGYLEFLPEKHTDFIFTLFSEEFGFVGSVLLLIIYAVIILRILVIGSSSRSYFGRIFCYGYASALFVYISINMCMVLGLLPIVGSPLPILSYGGSSMLATMIGFGIVMSTKIYSRQLII